MQKFNVKAQNIRCDGKPGIEKKNLPLPITVRVETNQNLPSYGRCGKVKSWSEKACFLCIV